MSRACLVMHSTSDWNKVGSTPIRHCNIASIAQLVVRLFCNQKVIGSSPIVGI